MSDVNATGLEIRIPKKGDRVSVFMDARTDNVIGLVGKVSESVGKDGLVYISFGEGGAVQVMDCDPCFHHSLFELEPEGTFRNPKSHRSTYLWILRLVPIGQDAVPQGR